ELRSLTRTRNPGHDGDLETERVGIWAGGSIAAVVQLRKQQAAERAASLEAFAADDPRLVVRASCRDLQIGERLECRLVYLLCPGPELMILPECVEQNRLVPSAEGDTHLGAQRRCHGGEHARGDDGEAAGGGWDHGLSCANSPPSARSPRLRLVATGPVDLW